MGGGDVDNSVLSCKVLKDGDRVSVQMEQGIEGLLLTKYCTCGPVAINGGGTY